MPADGPSFAVLLGPGSADDLAVVEAEAPGAGVLALVPMGLVRERPDGASAVGGADGVEWVEVDQRDPSAGVASALDRRAGRDLVLVVDRGWRLYGPSKATFEALFPAVVPGGRYLLDGWAWAHRPDQRVAHPAPDLAMQPALTNLLVELLMVVGSAGGAVAGMEVTDGRAIIRRGEAPLDAPFALVDHFDNRAIPFFPLL